MAIVYSCCFWFSLRLGGILIGLFSLAQALVVLTACCIAQSQPDRATEDITRWTNNMELIYTKEYLDNIILSFEKIIGLCISITSLYIITCLLFIYGAFVFNNMLMVSYIVVELIRLVILSALVATGLLILKRNTMDIGLLIGASVAGGFLLLGMFYLWVCALNLPVLINEMERDEQAATIAKLLQVLEMTNSKASTQDLNDVLCGGNVRTNRGSIFTVPQKTTEANSRIPMSYYANLR